MLDPNSKNIGARTGIAAYNGMNLPEYKDPYDVAGLQGSKYAGIATGNSMSPWSRLAMEHQKNLAAQQNAASKNQGQGMANKQANELARQGGLTSGAHERIQAGAGQNVLSMIQQNNQGAANNEANIGINDAKQRMEMLGDVTNKLTSMKAGNIQGMNAYNANSADMTNKAIAADMAAKAQVQAARESNDGSVIFIVATSLLGSLSPSEVKAHEMISKSSKFTRLKMVREALGSEEALRGYCKFSDKFAPEIAENDVAQKVLFHTMVRPLSKKGFIVKVWSKTFSILGRIS
jgi:hypothetical protein